MREEISPMASIGLFLGFLLMSLGAHGYWFVEDVRDARWDEIRYVEIARDAAATTELGWWNVPKLLSLDGRYPPGYPLLAALFRVPNDFRAGRAWLNGLLCAATALIVLGIGCRHLSIPWAAFAAVLTLANPALMNQTHVLGAEVLLVPMVCLTYAALMRIGEQPSVSGAALCGCALAGGMLVKWTFPVFVIVPGLWATAKVWRSLSGRVWAIALALLIPIIILALPWYVSHAPAVLEHLSAGALKGDDAYISAHSGLAGVFAYPKMLVFQALGVPMALLLGLGCILQKPRRWALWALMLLVPLTLLTMVRSKQLRHLLPLIPALSVLAAWIISRIKVKGLRYLLAALLLAHLSASSFWLVLWKGSSPELSLGSLRLPMLTRPLPPGIPDSRSWPHDELLNAVISAGAGREDETVFVASNLTPITAESLGHSASRRENGPRFIAPPLRFPRHHLRYRPFPLARVLSATVIVARASPSSDRYPGDQRGLHLWASRMCEELMAPGTAMHLAWPTVRYVALPDGAIASVHRKAQGDGPAIALAKFILRHDPEDSDAQSLLDSIAPPPIPSDLRAQPLQLNPGLEPKQLRRTRLYPEAGWLLLHAGLKCPPSSLERIMYFRRALESDRTMWPRIADALGKGESDWDTTWSWLRSEERRLREL